MKEPYGTWISPAGYVKEVGLMEHRLHHDYNIADDLGYIATVEKTFAFFARYNRETVTLKALQVLRKRVRDFPEVINYHAEDIFADQSWYNPPKLRKNPKQEFLNFINREISNKRADQ